MPARRKVTLKDLEQRTGLSVATISRALNNTGYVSAENRSLIAQAQRELGYVLPKRRLEPGVGSANTILVVIPDNKTSFWFEYLRGVQEVCKTYDCFVLLYFVAPDENEVDSITKAINSLNARGVIVVTLNAGEELCTAMTQFLLPRVLCAAHRIDSNTTQRNYDCISVDSQKGIFLAASHLADTGRRRIAYLGLNDSLTGTQRLQGFREAMAAHSLPVDESLISQCPEPECFENGRRSILRFAKENRLPDAVCAVNDRTALGVMRACRELGIDIPRGLAVVGMDNIDFAPSAAPALSSVDLAPFDQGRNSAQRLFHRMRDPGDLFRSTVLEPNLIVRESSAPL